MKERGVKQREQGQVSKGDKKEIWNRIEREEKRQQREERERKIRRSRSNK